MRWTPRPPKRGRQAAAARHSAQLTLDGRAKSVVQMLRGSRDMMKTTSPLPPSSLLKWLDAVGDEAEKSDYRAAAGNMEYKITKFKQFPT